MKGKAGSSSLSPSALSGSMVRHDLGSEVSPRMIEATSCSQSSCARGATATKVYRRSYISTAAPQESASSGVGNFSLSGIVS